MLLLGVICIQNGVICVSRSNGEFRVRFRWLHAVDLEAQVLTDYCFAWMQTIARHGSGTAISPVRVEFAQARSHRKAIERYFGCPVVCDAAHNTIVFRAGDAERPFGTRNAELRDMLAPQFEQELKQSTDQDSFATLVRRAVQEKLTGHRPAVEDLARGLHMSSRTLQRRLQEVGLETKT